MKRREPCSKQYMRKKNKGDLRFFIIVGILFIVGFVIFAYRVGRELELGLGKREEARGDLSDRFTPPRTVEVNGTTYRYRDGLLTLLLMGIDKTNQTEGVPSNFRNGGQADFFLLLVFDAESKTVTPIQIDRDTMTEITVLGVLGNEAGTRNAQICLSHGFGDGAAQSCGFAVEAVRNLLCGIDIDFYISVNMDAISVVNDALGGVMVTLTDDLTMLDPELKRGNTVRLSGEQAEDFVRARRGIGEGTNTARMERQRAYLSGASALLAEKLNSDGEFIGKLFDDLENSLQTNMKRGRMINEFYGKKDYQKQEIVTIEGNHEVGNDGFMEFHADERWVEEMVIGLFFKPV